MMRCLRLFLLNQGDVSIAYLHRKASGTASVNGTEMPVFLLRSGEPFPDRSEGLVMVLSAQPPLRENHFIAAKDGEPLLWLEQSGGGFIGCVHNPGFISVSQSVSLWKPIKAAVLTVSDKGSQGEREDRSGPALQRLLPDLGCQLQDYAVVPDEKDAICAKVRQWTLEGCHLVILTGGTGIAPRDVTPEALLSLSDRVVPGIGEAMRLRTASSKATAILSRGLAVAYNQTLLLALPGSERGVTECFQAVAPSLRHAVEILCGWSGDCGGGHSHH